MNILTFSFFILVESCLYYTERDIIQLHKVSKDGRSIPENFAAKNSLPKKSKKTGTIELVLHEHDSLEHDSFTAAKIFGDHEKKSDQMSSHVGQMSSNVNQMSNADEMSDIQQYTNVQYNLSPDELKMILKRFDSRIENLKSTCDEIRLRDISARNGLALTVEDKNFIACASWKCSSTYWKRFAESLKNSTQTETKSTTRSKSDIVKSEDAIKVLIVRHPFVRLISSWNEKYSRQHKHANHYYKTSKNFEHYEHDNWHRNESASHLVSFKDFIYWLALDHGSKNPHFAPQTKMCKPCQNFNFLIKVETMSEDTKAMFQSKNFSLPNDWVLSEPQRNFQGGFGTSGIQKIIDHTKFMFQPIPEKIIKALMEKFDADFSHYGYKFDITSKIASGFD